ncbi:hypothetical protein [Cecembia rubra]|uniref:hypothetical protein n=1 Tax=Cecembia rubra TaxID=1485585 RepID=UPI002714D6CF|nr:hypothetical protein [Cecembia rubra]
MKKILLILIAQFFVFNVQAQMEKGRFLIGAGTNFGVSDNSGMMNLSFSTTRSEFEDGSSSGEGKDNAIFIAPKAGYFLMENLAVGLDFALGWGWSYMPTSDFDFKSRNSLFGLGPFVRYYVPTGKILPFAEINSIFGSQNMKSEIEGGVGSGISLENNISFTHIGGGLGLALLLGDQSSLDLVLNYNSNRRHNETLGVKTRQNTLGIKVGFTVFLGKK